MQAYFLKLKSNLELEPTFAEKVSKRHIAVREYLKNNHPGFKDAKLIGSLQRLTRIHPGPAQKFDIDIIVIMGEFYDWMAVGGVSPHAAMDALHSTVDASARYNAMEPVQDAPTISLTATDGLEVQLVPAYVDMVGRDPTGSELGAIGRGYWVVKEARWQMADYDYEAEWISLQNRSSGGYLIPAIKMLKAIKRQYFPELESFPLEILAGQIVPASVMTNQLLGRPISYEEIILKFFDVAPANLLNPIQVPGSKSSAILLSHATAVSVTKRFKMIADYIRATSSLNAQGKKAENWRKLFGDHFPANIQ